MALEPLPTARGRQLTPKGNSKTLLKKNNTCSTVITLAVTYRTEEKREIRLTYRDKRVGVNTSHSRDTFLAPTPNV